MKKYNGKKTKHIRMDLGTWDHKWFTFKQGETIPEELVKNFSEDELIEIEDEVINLDINNDGKFDEEDVSLAGKVLRKSRKKPRNSKK